MSRISVVSPGSWFEQLGGSAIEGSPEYPFRLRVLVAGFAVTPRHSMFKYFIELGAGFIPKILKHEPLNLRGGEKLLFVLPERWMSVHEQHSFLSRLWSHPDALLLDGVDIVTQSPLLVGGVAEGSLGMFDLPVGDVEAGMHTNAYPYKPPLGRIKA